jgi:hypothetical protein
LAERAELSDQVDDGPEKTMKRPSSVTVGPRSSAPPLTPTGVALARVIEMIGSA